MLSKWHVQSDDSGNFYFYNSITGDSVWELPDEELQVPEETEKQVDDSLKNPQEHANVYTIALAVADVMVKLVETTEENTAAMKKSKGKRKFMSPAAEKRYLKNAAKDDKKKQQVHTRTVTTYVNALMQLMEPGGSATVAKRQVGSLFTAEESQNWQQEREREREIKRRAVRRARRQHHAKVASLQQHQHMLLQLRSELMKYLVRKIQCSTELQRQRILLLTTPQMLAEMQTHKRKLQLKAEPEIAEKMQLQERISQQKYDKNVNKVFVAIDEAGTGKLHLLQILFGILSRERPHKYAAKVRGLAELLRSTELQRFLIEFVSQVSQNEAGGRRLLCASEFREFVSIIEEVLDHYTGVQAAVKDAEYEIKTTLAAATSGGVSLARAMMGAMSAKKTRHELAVMKEHEAQLDAVRRSEKRRGFGAEGDSFVPLKDEWEKNHHHRLIRLRESFPLYCCLCRRRKWELQRREQEERESDYRCHWPTMHALRVKDDELRLERARANSIPLEARIPAQLVVEARHEQDASSVSAKDELAAVEGRTDTVCEAVRETLGSLVRLVESTAIEESSESCKPPRKVYKKPMTMSPRKRVKEPPTTEAQEHVQVVDKEEQERKTMYTEELHMVLMLERNRRVLERPLLRAENAAHDAFARLVGHCVNPSGFLSRLEFERCLAFVPPQKMALAVLDQGVKNANRLVLHTIPCRTEMMADYLFMQATNMWKTLQSPFVAEVAAVEKKTFHLFSESGLLVECWPVVFIVTEYFDNDKWLNHYRRFFVDTDNNDVKYLEVEQHLRNIFREVASGLAAMHSLGLLHLNVNLENIYISNDENSHVHVKIGGLLSWKHDFDAFTLQSSNLQDCFNYNYAPPEVVNELPITAKADVWMLGCALCDALFMWQQQQLIVSTTTQTAQHTQPLIFHTKSITELLSKLPLAASLSMTSLLRMLLQPNPAQRPQISQVVDLLCRS